MKHILHKLMIDGNYENTEQIGVFCKNVLEYLFDFKSVISGRLQYTIRCVQ